MRGHLLTVRGAKGLLAVLALRLAALHLHGGHAEVTLTWGHLGWLLTTTGLDDIVSLHVTAHFVVTDLLLELDKLVVQTSVELVSLNKHSSELFLSNDSLIELVIELGLSGVLCVSIDQSIQGLSLLGNSLRNVSSLSFKLVVFGEVLCVSCDEGIENSFLVSVVLGNFHELLDSVEVFVHGNTFGHHGILLFVDFVQLVKSVLDDHHDGVGADILTSVGLGDLGNDVTAGLANDCEHLLVTFVSLDDLLVNSSGLAHLLLVVIDVLAVGSVYSGGGNDLTEVVLLSKIGITLFFLVDLLLDGPNDVVVDLDEVLVGGN